MSSSSSPLFAERQKKQSEKLKPKTKLEKRLGPGAAPLGRWSKWLLHRCTTATARLPSLVFCLVLASLAAVCECACVCTFSDVDVDAEVYKMHNLALPFHQLPFSSCPSARSRSLSPLCVCVSLRLVSSLRLFFIFILAFVFIDSQVVWLFHFSFGRKTFDLHSGLPAPSRPYSNVFFSLPLHLLSLATPIRFLVCCLSLGISG